MKKILLAMMISWCCCAVQAQTITDGLLMPKGALCTGFVYGTEQWTDYWEGTRKRENGNVGTVTTSNVMWMGNYGVIPKLNVIAMAPYVWTKASGGTMRQMEGVQDLTLAVKYQPVSVQLKENKLKTFVLASLSAPLTDYTPDFLPLSIGMASTNLAFRGTVNYQLDMGLYFNASGAYTFRSNVELDRDSYYTDGQLFMTNKVDMPNVIDYVLSVGYHKGALQVDANYTQMYTTSGGDIRRQDMPFVSNQMNFTKLGGTVMYYLPAPKGLAVRAAAATTLTGRNVGKATGYSAGLLYTIRFTKPAN